MNMTHVMAEINRFKKGFLVSEFHINEREEIYDREEGKYHNAVRITITLRPKNNVVINKKLDAFDKLNVILSNMPATLPEESRNFDPYRQNNDGREAQIRKMKEIIKNAV